MLRRTVMKAYTPSPPMQALLEQMSRDMAVPVEGLVNQALFNWAKLHGYVEPGRVGEETEPQAARAPRSERFALIVGEREVPVDSERFLIGRDLTCNLTIDAARVSRQHAVILVGREGAELQDLGSSNGTWFEGQRIERRALRHGDLLHLGETPVRVVVR